MPTSRRPPRTDVRSAKVKVDGISKVPCVSVAPLFFFFPFSFNVGFISHCSFCLSVFIPRRRRCLYFFMIYTSACLKSHIYHIIYTMNMSARAEDALFLAAWLTSHEAEQCPDIALGANDSARRWRQLRDGGLSGDPALQGLVYTIIKRWGVNTVSMRNSAQRDREHGRRHLFVPRRATDGAAAVSAFPCREALERWGYWREPASMRQTRLCADISKNDPQSEDTC
jgi:hypothetical protein